MFFVEYIFNVRKNQPLIKLTQAIIRQQSV